MKVKHLNKVIGASVVIGSMFIAQNVWAVAGDLIDNVATIDYAVDGVDQTDIASSPDGNSIPGTSGTVTQFVEDQIINFAVVTDDANTVPVAPDSTAQTLSFTVYNIVDGASSTVTNPGSNGTITVSLSHNNLTGVANPLSPGDASDTFDTDGVCTLSTDTVTLVPGASVPVLVTCDIPAEIGGQAGGGNLVEDNIAALNLVGVVTEGYDGTSTVSIASTSNATVNDMMTVQFVFAEADANDPDGDDTLYNGGHSDQSAFRIVKPSLRVTKTATVLNDPINGAVDPKAIPGAVIQYTIVVANTGNTTAEAVVINDDLSTNPDVTFNGTVNVTTDFAGGGTDSSTTSPEEAIAECGDLATNEQCTLTFEVLVDY